MHEMYDKYTSEAAPFKQTVGFLVVYIQEAHAQDEWKLGTNVCINQHKTIDERIAAAKSFIDKYKFRIPVVVDDINNGYDETYGVWPDRYFGIENKVMKLLPVPGSYGYDRTDLQIWLSFGDTRLGYVKTKEQQQLVVQGDNL